MSSTVYGLTGDEIISYIQNWTGNTSAGFQTFLTSLLPMAESRYCKMHAWSFLEKNNLSLTVASGTPEYSLTAANIGFAMSSTDVQQIFSQANGIPLKKVELSAIRRMDPDINDGTTSSKLTHWAPLGDNRIYVYPPTFSDTTLKIDGKIRPVTLYTSSNYPTIPLHYQDGFIQYVLALALDRENDDRANTQKQFALELIKQDVKDDLKSLGDTENPRFKHLSEQGKDGESANLDQLYMNWAWNSED